MKSFDFDAVVYDGSVYCTNSLPDDVPRDDDQVYPIFTDSELDSYPVCDACGREHDYMVLNQYGPVASLGEDG
jgi:hypothetical protein